MKRGIITICSILITCMSPAQSSIVQLSQQCDSLIRICASLDSMPETTAWVESMLKSVDMLSDDFYQSLHSAPMDTLCGLPAMRGAAEKRKQYFLVCEDICRAKQILNEPYHRENVVATYNMLSERKQVFLTPKQIADVEQLMFLLKNYRWGTTMLLQNVDGIINAYMESATFHEDVRLILDDKRINADIERIPFLKTKYQSVKECMSIGNGRFYLSKDGLDRLQKIKIEIEEWRK